ncbi:MAG: thiamine phosphate synthase, partial [Chromatiales bacterium]|nr:thiamine phosphate synthase [Chromatiales bacterium]
PDNEADYLARLEQRLQGGTRLMQFKAKGLDEATYRRLAEKVIVLAHRYDCKVLLTGELALVDQLGADGLHLDSKALSACSARPVALNLMLAVSGHTLAAMQKGEKLGADFGVLSPVNYTSAHPDIEPLGWEGLKEVCGAVSLPIYALGGVSVEDEENAKMAGAAGIAGNKGYW